tara:strand:+ start:322 stop:507 length:186 start_codon:yes stop_codon:yes gene_type:complete
MKTSYQINIKEVKSADYTIEANSLTEAKDLAYWRLHTQTEPSIKPKVSYDVQKIKEDNENE